MGTQRGGRLKEYVAQSSTSIRLVLLWLKPQGYDDELKVPGRDPIILIPGLYLGIGLRKV
jgi:hypothetical protein